MKPWKLMVGALLVGGVLALTAAANVGDVPHGDGIQGARLYDNWFNALGINPPEGDHPLWATQESNPRSGSVTWRCKECHGWDYKGAEGAYGEGSQHHTGFPGILDMVGEDNDQIVAWLDGTNNPNHNFVQYMGKSALEDLVAFMRTKLIDTDLLVDFESRAALGESVRGRRLFREGCVECHGEDGRLLNLSGGAEPVYLGDVAYYDPWRAIHKIRFGHPVGSMPSFEAQGWTLQQVADVLASAQTLPMAQQPPEEELPENGSEVDLSGQGDLAGIVAGGTAIVLVILGGLGWFSLKER